MLNVDDAVTIKYTQIKYKINIFVCLSRVIMIT